MKAALLLFGTASLASAATVNYSFEGNNNNATTSGVGFSVGSLIEGGNLSTGAIYGGFTSSTAPTDTTTVRAYIPNNVVNQSAPPISSHSTYVEFTLTPDAGQTLDLSAATLLFTLGAATGISANNDMPAYAQAGYRINSGAFTALGAVVSATAPTYNANTPNWTSNGSSGGFATGVNFDVRETAASLPLAGLIAGLNPGDTVTFRIAMGDNSAISNSLTSNTGVWKTVYLNDVGISDFNVIPEPSTGLLTMITLAAASYRRRRP